MSHCGANGLQGESLGGGAVGRILLFPGPRRDPPGEMEVEQPAEQVGKVVVHPHPRRHRTAEQPEPEPAHDHDAGFDEDLEHFSRQFGDLGCGTERCFSGHGALIGLLLRMAEAPPARERFSAGEIEERREAFLSLFEGPSRLRAAEILDLGRASYRLRDNDNLPLGKIEGGLLAAADQALSEADVQKIREVLPEKATVQPAKPRKVLLFYRCEGFRHTDGILWGDKAFELMGQKTGAYSTVESDDMAMFEPASDRPSPAWPPGVRIAEGCLLPKAAASDLRATKDPMHWRELLEFRAAGVTAEVKRAYGAAQLAWGLPPDKLDGGERVPFARGGDPEPTDVAVSRANVRVIPQAADLAAEQIVADMCSAPDGILRVTISPTRDARLQRAAENALLTGLPRRESA